MLTAPEGEFTTILWETWQQEDRRGVAVETTPMGGGGRERERVEG